MARLTIAQLREKEVIRLSALTEDMAKAQNLMNRYYRLCGMDERLLYLENDERTYNRRSTKELEARRDKAFDRLQNDFQAVGLKMVYFGYLPTICPKDSTATAIYSYFYN